MLLSARRVLREHVLVARRLGLPPVARPDGVRGALLLARAILAELRRLRDVANPFERTPPTSADEPTAIFLAFATTPGTFGGWIGSLMPALLAGVQANRSGFALDVTPDELLPHVAEAYFSAQAGRAYDLRPIHRLIGERLVPTRPRGRLGVQDAPSPRTPYALAMLAR